MAASLMERLHVIERGPIQTSDAGAPAKLQAKIDAAEHLQKVMKETNAAIRKNAKAGPEAQIKALVSLGHPEDRARKLIEPDFAGRIGFPNYALTNNNANIRRMKERVGEVTRAHALPESTTHHESGVHVEVSPSENRIRIHFPGKPDEATRAELKRTGFRWSPTQGAWSAYNNDRSRASAERIAGPKSLVVPEGAVKMARDLTEKDIEVLHQKLVSHIIRQVRREAERDEKAGRTQSPYALALMLKAAQKTRDEISAEGGSVKAWTNAVSNNFTPTRPMKTFLGKIETTFSASGEEKDPAATRGVAVHPSDRGKTISGSDLQTQSGWPIGTEHYDDKLGSKTVGGDWPALSLQDHADMAAGLEHKVGELREEAAHLEKIGMSGQGVDSVHDDIAHHEAAIAAHHEAAFGKGPASTQLDLPVGKPHDPTEAVKARMAPQDARMLAFSGGRPGARSERLATFAGRATEPPGKHIGAKAKGEKAYQTGVRGGQFYVTASGMKIYGKEK